MERRYIERVRNENKGVVKIKAKEKERETRKDEVNERMRIREGQIGENESEYRDEEERSGEKDVYMDKQFLR